MTLFFYSPTILSLTKVNEHIKQNYEFLGSRETMKLKAAMYGGAGRGGQDDFILERAEDSVLRKPSPLPGLGLQDWFFPAQGRRARGGTLRWTM